MKPLSAEDAATMLGVSKREEDWRERWYVEMDRWFKEQATADNESNQWDLYIAWCADVGYAPTSKGWLAWAAGRKSLLVRLDLVRERIGAFFADRRRK